MASVKSKAKTKAKAKPKPTSKAAQKPRPDGEVPERFGKLGIRQLADLALHLPMRYEDQTRITPIGRLQQLLASQIVQVQARVVRNEVAYRGRRSLLVELEDDTGTIYFRFFNFYPSQVKQLAVGQLIRANGEVRRGLFGSEIVHPRCKVVQEDTPLPQTLTPVYPSVAKITQQQIQKAVADAIKRVTFTEFLSSRELSTFGLLDLTSALHQLHWPTIDVPLQSLQDHSSPAWRRIILDELLAQQFALRRARAERDQLKAAPLTKLALATKLKKQLPFSLTEAQQRVWDEIASNLASGQPMNRLLLGDVGSGKTVVAALAACAAIGSGFQAALMAPTEILARQHASKLTPWLHALGIEVDHLYGSLKESEKKIVRARVASGEVKLLVGTHALLEQGCEFERLGLSIVDEQHRFGVAQRLKLRSKSTGLDPHQLMMSATPIPRTLAMSYYADLDVSVIDELPPGRQPVRTRLLAESKRDEVIARVRAAALDGRQVYWVCPLIEESEAIDLQTAIDTHVQLESILAPVKVGLVHGRQSATEKQQAMQRFIAGELPVLVATTVIEVGVDVPQASLMVIENAERFGMAQLHQLRGRVGRGAEQSTCVMLYRSPLSDNARERLKALYETTDGFEIARRDLAIRGPGEFLGARQSGTPLLRYGDLERDVELLEIARDLAAGLENKNQAAVSALLARWFGGREDFLKA